MVGASRPDDSVSHWRACSRVRSRWIQTGAVAVAREFQVSGREKASGEPGRVKAKMSPPSGSKGWKVSAGSDQGSGMVAGSGVMAEQCTGWREKGFLGRGEGCRM